MIRIESVESNRSEICRDILEGLPEWFGIPEATERFISDSAGLPMFGAFKAYQCVGFISLKRQTYESMEIYVLGVRPEVHRRGIGRQLIDASASYAASHGSKLLTVKTLGPSDSCDEYERTRLFYESVGFIAIEELLTLWPEGIPCLLMVKVLAEVAVD